MTLVQDRIDAAPALALFEPRAQIVIETEAPTDVAAREALLDAAFGRKERFAKTCQRLRGGRLAARGLSLVAREGETLVGTLRFWHVDAGGAPALLLGPLAVSKAHRSLGLGSKLMVEGLQRAKALGHGAVILVGDAAYYEKFGFSRGLTRGLVMPGPVEEARFLGLELRPASLCMAHGLVRATGAVDLDVRRVEWDYAAAA